MKLKKMMAALTAAAALLSSVSGSLLPLNSITAFAADTEQTADDCHDGCCNAYAVSKEHGIRCSSDENRAYGPEAAAVRFEDSAV